MSATLTAPPRPAPCCGGCASFHPTMRVLDPRSGARVRLGDCRHRADPDAWPVRTERESCDHHTPRP